MSDSDAEAGDPCTPHLFFYVACLQQRGKKAKVGWRFRTGDAIVFREAAEAGIFQNFSSDCSSIIPLETAFHLGRNGY